MRYEFEVTLKKVRPKPAAAVDVGKARVSPLRRTLVLAYQIADYMNQHRVPTLSAFCQTAGITRARATQITNLLHFSPRIQEQILSSEDHRLIHMSEQAVRPLLTECLWDRQEELWDALLFKATLTSPQT